MNSTFSVSCLWVLWWLWWSNERFRNDDESVFDFGFGFEESWSVEVCWWWDVFVRKARDDGWGV